MKSKLFNTDIPRRCQHCVYSREFDSATDVLCSKRGVVGIRDYCRKYVYDVTKRVPNKHVLADDYKRDDFII